MNYQTGAPFRRALEERLKRTAINSGMPLVRLRKMVAFDRFLARLVSTQPDTWVLKGGLALQMRLGDRSRTTRDIDLLSYAPAEQVLSHLREAASYELDDWFRFEVPAASREGNTFPSSQRFTIHSFLDGRNFEDFHVDIGIGNAVIEPPEYYFVTELLLFAGLPATSVPCYPVTQQIAEKLHAYTKPRHSGESSRVKDLIDIILLADLQEISAPVLRNAIEATFNKENTHEIPLSIQAPPAGWAAPYRRIASELGLSITSLEDAFALVRTFINPVLRSDFRDEWDPVRKIWT